MQKAEKKKSGFLKVVLLVLLLVGGGIGFLGWKYILKNNVELAGENYKFLYLPAESTYEDLKEILKDDALVKDIESFDWYARRMKLPDNIHPGRYRIVDGMSNRQLVKILKNGKEEKVKLVINYTTRNKEQLIQKLSSKFNMNENELEEFLDDGVKLNSLFGLDENTIMTMIRPGEYELSWATSVEQFFDLMKNEYKKFWTEIRRKKAEELNRSQSEIMIMASIVQCESQIESEQKKIASVYFNRLRKEMALQADPTVIFAKNDFTIQRVLSDDLDIDSPYNTYKYKGLPPGPICFPTDQAVAAVLNAEKSDYIFFCAKPSLNGYSDFSCTLEQHEKFAKAYRDAMDKKGIKR